VGAMPLFSIYSSEVILYFKYALVNVEKSTNAQGLRRLAENRFLPLRQNIAGGRRTKDQ
jgi:hypothetical protein